MVSETVADRPISTLRPRMRMNQLPEEFDIESYRSLHSDLAGLRPNDLIAHYRNFGRTEGRAANSLRDRNDFVRLVPEGASALEIGPFCNPLLRGPNVSYFDVLTLEALVAQARHFGLDPSGIPSIDFVGELSSIGGRFDVVLSSHCLEHQPDIVRHLQEVEQLLMPDGAYFLLVPDKRYCFDHFIPLSNLAEVIVAHREQRKTHTLRSVIECRALTTHNDNVRHWQGDHGIIFEGFEERLQAALEEYYVADGKYIDVHAWYFNPDSASAILSALQSMGLSKLEVQRVYPTRYGANEFWMILKRSSSAKAKSVTSCQDSSKGIETDGVHGA
jgi:SAM-dependent methyltransferase